MSNSIDYAGNPIPDPETNAVRLAGAGERWAHQDDENITRIEGNDCSYAMREEAHVDAYTGDTMHEDDLRYVDFNDAYTSERYIHRLYNRSTEYIPECGDHVEDYDGNPCHPDDICSCENCDEPFHEGLINGSGRCMSCEEDRDDGYGDSSYVQSYHDHNLSGHIQVFTEPEPELKKKHRQHYTVGFEVEKTSNGWSEGDSIPRAPLFAYWEEDGSCGIEGITHAYSLGSAHTFRDHVSASSRMVGLEISNRCGGHLSLKGPKVSRDTARKYIGLIYAIYRQRLDNSYCNEDPRLVSTYEFRYAPVRTRHNPDRCGVGFIEYRIPRAVKNATQLINRFELMQLVADAIHEDKTFKQYLRSNAPLLRRIYPDKEKRKSIYEMAWAFQNWVDTGAQHDSIRTWARAL